MLKKQIVLCQKLIKSLLIRRLSTLAGVIKVESGYIGGEIDNPTYQQVCDGVSKHYEAVRVLYDNDQTNYESLTKLFFELHDPTQVDGQGPDIGAQYQSAIFYHDEQQKIIAMNLIDQLKCAGSIPASSAKLPNTIKR